MVPSKAWFPSGLQEQADWFQNFTTQLPNYSATLGVTAGEINTLVKDNEDFQSIAATTLTLDNFRASIRQYRISLLEDSIGSPQPVFPFEDFSAPPNDQPAGVFERLDILVRKIRGAPNFNEEIGEALGIMPKKSNDGNFFDTPPVLKISASPGNIVSVAFKRGASDGIHVEMRLDNGTWSSVGNFFKSPVDIQVPTGPSEGPRFVEIRARYLDGNSPVGNNSDVVSVSTTP